MKTKTLNHPFVLIVSAVSVICLVIGQSSCTKKELGSGNTVVAPIPIVFPHSYLPAYPGSYWVYKTGVSGTYTVTTGPTYVHDSVNTASFTNRKYYHAMVPVYNGRTLWGVKTHYYGQAGNNSLIWLPYLQDSGARVGNSWECPRTFGATVSTHFRLTLASDTSIVVNGTTFSQVIATRDYISTNGIIPESDTYYAKDVGAIAIFYYNTGYFRNMSPAAYIPRDSAIGISELKSYFINK